LPTVSFTHLPASIHPAKRVFNNVFPLPPSPLRRYRKLLVCWVIVPLIKLRKEELMRRSLYALPAAFALAPLAIAVLVLSSSASAAPVALGESVTLPSVDTGGGTPFVPPTGDLLASDSRTLAFTYVPEPGTQIADGRDPNTSLQLTSEVRRDPATGKLSFFYGITPVDDTLKGREDSTVSVKSFASFATDVTAENTSADVFVSRTLDGATVTSEVRGGGTGYTPSVAIATDATDFDRNGSLTISLVDEFGITDVNNPGAGTTGNVTATATFDGIFQPIATDGGGGGGGGGGGNAIPLPPAVWSGMIMLLAAAALLRRQHPAIR